MLLLKKKRYQEQLLDKTENQISNLERMVSEGPGLFQGGAPLGSRGIPFQLAGPGGCLALCPRANVSKIVHVPQLFPGDTEWCVWNLQAPC